MVFPVLSNGVWAGNGGLEVTVPAGGSVDLPAEGYCVNYGKPFPGSELVLMGPAPSEIRALLAYAYAKGYTRRQPYQVQRAVWHFTDRLAYDPRKLPVTDELVRYARGGGAVAVPAGVLDLGQGVRQGAFAGAAGGFPYGFQADLLGSWRPPDQ